MQLRTLLGGFLAGVLYPLWLLAGAGDYFCHRRTDIAHTSGRTESWLHVAQFAAIGVILVCAVVLQITLPILILMIAALAAHNALAFADVSFTNRRRYISPLEQSMHSLLEVIPIVAVCLIALLHWDQLTVGASQAALRLKDEPLGERLTVALLGSFFVLAGVPIFEELVRTRRARARIGAARFQE